MFVLIWLGAPLLSAAVLGAALGTGRRGIGLLVLLGLLLAVGVFFYAYLTAPPDYQHDSRGCSDCEEYWGRWWEPGWALFVVGVGYSIWLLGLVIGAFLRWIVGPLLSPST